MPAADPRGFDIPENLLIVCHRDEIMRHPLEREGVFFLWFPKRKTEDGKGGITDRIVV